MVALLLLLVPFISGVLAFFIKDHHAARVFALISSVITLVIALIAVFTSTSGLLNIDAVWLSDLNARFTLNMDGMSKMLCLLNAISLPLVLSATYKNNQFYSNGFFALMLLMQTGMMGVFLASDLLLFYFFWEVALIPAYFLCSTWGGERRIPVTFKFFVYTFAGSLLMLAGILMLYFKAGGNSFAHNTLINATLSGGEEHLIFWLFFIAFAIKMPMFPFHTWQPDTYEQAPTPVTMILSGVMVKMGIFAVIRWLIPVFPEASSYYANLIIILSITGMLYASLIAIRQDDIKRLVAYSSIAHIGLMIAAIFSANNSGMHGVMIQMFNHGVNVIGLWIVADVIENKYGTRKFSELGGLAQRSPTLAILFMIMCLANIALPLTNAFIGEFLMFSGLFKHSFLMAAVALVSIILAAVYTLNMMQKLFFGSTAPITENATDSALNVNFALVILAITIIVLGIFPQPMLDLTHDTVTALFAKIH